ncbi:MAG: ATP phosphoribosyltransferase regulatory subunit, partial [Thermoplasmata archaeon]|nr:ATP phosphoribosyltransferase regulatory subunit [Thermoplasmata archaeon]
MFQRPRGTRDFTPAQTGDWRHVEASLRAVMDRFGFKEIMTHTFESLDLFTKKSGPSIIEETYAFKDKGGRDMALRPEFTPSVVRMYIDSMQRFPKPLKLYYFGNCFRYDEPQKGRYREFFQFGVEIVGGDDVSADAELIALAVALLEASGLKRFQLRIGHIGILRELTKGLKNQQKILQSIDKKDYDRMRALLEKDGAQSLEK